MYEKYTRMSLPDREYRLLLASAIYTFNTNNAQMVKFLIKYGNLDEKEWYRLMDCESGKLKREICKLISPERCKNINEISDFFGILVEKRNRIIHSFPTTNNYGEQMLRTKEKSNSGDNQYDITKEELMDFIKQNEKMSDIFQELKKEKFF
mgnify:FL=1